MNYTLVINDGIRDVKTHRHTEFSASLAFIQAIAWAMLEDEDYNIYVVNNNDDEVRWEATV